MTGVYEGVCHGMGMRTGVTPPLLIIVWGGREAPHDNEMWGLPV